MFFVEGAYESKSMLSKTSYSLRAKTKSMGCIFNILFYLIIIHFKKLF